jgi:hypothetical protein
LILKIRYLFALILIFPVSVAAVSQEDSDVSLASDSVGGSSDATSDVSTGSSSVGSDLQGIWRFNLAETEVNVAISQSGDSIYGYCKFEGDNPWDGVVSGSVSGKAVHIALVALQGKVLVSTAAEATLQDDSLTGSYVKADSEGNVALGELTATKISADVSDYTPAKVESQAETISETTTKVKKTTSAVDQSEEGSGATSSNKTASVDETSDQSSQDSLQQTAQLGSRTQKSGYKKAQYHSVNDLAKGLDPNIMPRSYPL